MRMNNVVIKYVCLKEDSLKMLPVKFLSVLLTHKLLLENSLR